MTSKQADPIGSADAVSGVSPSQKPELPAGARIGRYLVLSTIGRGGMGVVYKAYDPELDRRIALKLTQSDARA